MNKFSIMHQIRKMKNYYDMDDYCLIDIYLIIKELPIGLFKLSNIEDILSSEVLVFVTNYRLVVYDRGNINFCDSKREFKKDS